MARALLRPRGDTGRPDAPPRSSRSPQKPRQPPIRGDIPSGYSESATRTPGRCTICQPTHRQPTRRAAPAATLAAALTTSAALAGPVIAPGWGTPIFEDNFDGRSINQGVWQVANWAGSNNNESQYYHPGQVSLQNSALVLRADRDPGWSFGREYNSGLVRTWQEWSHGRFEVRARVPNGQGFWPAIWLLPRGASWPAGGEIDIMEARGDLPYRISSAVHWGWDEANHQYVSQAYESGANFQQGFHDYAVEWEVGTVRFYVDGVLHYELFEPAIGIPSTPKSIVLNLAVGGDYSGYPDWTTPFPASFDIDYVRVWQRPEIIAPPTSRLADPGFEDIALTEWQTFGNTIDNVTSDWGTPRDGQRSLKVYGQFTGTENYAGAFQNIPINGNDRFTASAHALTRSEDSIAGTTNTARLKVEFYSEPGGEYGSPAFLGEIDTIIADATSPEDTWTPAEITGIAPTGTVEARVAIVLTQPASNPGGSVFVDSVTFDTTCAADLTTDGTSNGIPDGRVTLSDFSYYLRLWPLAHPVTDVTTDGTSNGIPDGQVTLSDFSLYLTLWSAGCP